MKRAFYIWNIKNTESGDPLKIAAEAVKAGLTDVFVKVADGVYKFNVDKAKGDLVPAVVGALRAVGIRVWGWQYCYGQQPDYEEKVATQRIQELKLTNFIVDAEGEFEAAGFDKNADTYLSRLKAHNPGVTIAFSSYRFPHLHQTFPWSVFYKYCDVNMPQDYWLQAHNATEQTQTCFKEFKAMGKLPIWPTAPAWKQDGWRPTLEEIQGFEQVAAKEGAEIVSYWDWEQCRRDLPELWPVAASSTPAPIGPSQDDRLTVVEQKISDLDKVLANLSTVIADLKVILAH